ncbi:monocarboxylate transporter 9 [Biomphalaria glabrata]|nr:monocarboxylate transporter 9-like [Biomphalaria glabrata]
MGVFLMFDTRRRYMPSPHYKDNQQWNDLNLSYALKTSNDSMTKLYFDLNYTDILPLLILFRSLSHISLGLLYRTVELLEDISISLDDQLSQTVNKTILGCDGLKEKSNTSEAQVLLDSEKTQEQENEVEFNPDSFYSWLRPPFDDMAIGKKSKDSSTKSISSSSSSSLPVPTPPDGGWGWLVVLGAFSVSFICDGLSYCFGVLYAELLDQFKETKSKTSLVGSIFFGVAMILGPFSSALTTRFGSRTMTITGGCLACFGLVLSHFATSIEMLCFTFSVIVGTGFSFCYISSVVIVSFYFEKRRSLATGLAVCGTGVGTVTFAPLMNYLITEYGMRGLFLIMAGISLNLVVCGMLFRPLKFTESERWEMLLEEFNKIPYSREDIELGRSRYPSESSDQDTDENLEDDIEARTLSVLSLPTFVQANVLDIPSDILMEALKTSKNPHLTLQRYMKNAMLEINHANEQRALQEQEDGVDGHSFNVNEAELQHEILSNLPPSSFIDNAILKLANSSSITNMVGKIEDVNGNSSHPEDKLAKVSHAKTHAHLASNDVDSKGKETAKLLPKDPSKTKESAGMKSEQVNSTHKSDSKGKVQTIVQVKNEVKGKDILCKALDSKKSVDIQHTMHHRREYSGMSAMLTDKGCAKEAVSVVKRLGGVHMGRHNALGIHLPLYRTDIFYRRMLKNNTLHKNTLATSCPELSETIVVETKRNFVYEMLINFTEETVDILKSMVEFRLFCNPFFIVFVLSNFTYYFWSDVPYMYASDHAQNNGVPTQQASFLLSIIGIFNTLGQVVFGIVGDLNINLLNVYAIVSTLAGVFVAMIPFMTTYVNMCIGYSLFGFCISVSFPLTTVLLIRFLGVNKLTNAYGLLMLMQGIANFMGPPFAGMVSDKPYHGSRGTLSSVGLEVLSNESEVKQREEL